MLSSVQAKVDIEGRIDWKNGALDATIVKAHQHAAGARREVISTEGGTPTGEGVTRGFQEGAASEEERELVKKGIFQARAKEQRAS